MTKSISSAVYGRFRELLRSQREKLGITQAELANRIGQPQQFVSRYELGERRLDVGEFLEIAPHLDLDPVKVIKRLLAD
ncbi:MAG: helix-turn-helix transcriptional regulator [Rhodospirillales bacterium]